MSEATSGSESAEWLEATQFLTSIEKDAVVARNAAKNAITFAQDGHLGEALKQAEHAVLLESRHRRAITWKPLCDAIAALQRGDPLPDNL